MRQSKICMSGSETLAASTTQPDTTVQYAAYPKLLWAFVSGTSCWKYLLLARAKSSSYESRSSGCIQWDPGSAGWIVGLNDLKGLFYTDDSVCDFLLDGWKRHPGPQRAHEYLHAANQNEMSWKEKQFHLDCNCYSFQIDTMENTTEKSICSCYALNYLAHLMDPSGNLLRRHPAHCFLFRGGSKTERLHILRLMECLTNWKLFRFKSANVNPKAFLYEVCNILH